MIADGRPITGDHGRAAVYAAEITAFDGTDLEEVRSHGEIVSLIDRVTSGSWWPGPRLTVVRSRRGAESSATHGPPTELSSGAVTVRLVATQATVATAAHELAHALAGVGHGHDEIFRRAYLDVVAVITNLDSSDRRHDVHVGQLSDAFAAAGLRVGERAWLPPGDSSGQAIAL